MVRARSFLPRSPSDYTHTCDHVFLHKLQMRGLDRGSATADWQSIATALLRLRLSIESAMAITSFLLT